MKRIICLILSIIMTFTAVNISAFAVNDAKVVYMFNGKTETAVNGLKQGDVYYPDRMPSAVPQDKIFIGWQDENGKLVDAQGVVLEKTSTVLCAAFADKAVINKQAYITEDKTKNGKIHLPYIYNDTYYPSVCYEFNGGFGPKEFVYEGEDAPYTRFVSGEYNGRGATLLFDENGVALTGEWNRTYEITIEYRITGIERSIQLQPIFGLKREKAQYLNSESIKANILKLGHTDELVKRWNYDISGGDYEYWFATGNANASEFNLLSGGFSDWRTVTYTVNTGKEDDDYLPVIGIYVNVGGGYNASVLEIKNITLTDKNSASVEYVENGKTVAVLNDLEKGSYYAIDRAVQNTSTHYFAGWYYDAEFKNQARSGFILESGKTTLYAKMEEYKDSLVISSSAETGKGWEAHKHTLRENNWWCYRILVGAYGIKNGKYGDLMTEGQAHRHFGAEADGNTAVADESGLKHEKRDRNNRIWYGFRLSDYILRNENGEAFIVEPETMYKVELTYTFDNSLNPEGFAEYYLGAGLSSDILLYSGEMILNDLDYKSVPVDKLSEYGHSEADDLSFYSESKKVRLTPTTTDKQITLYIITPSLKTFEKNNLLQVLSLSDNLSEKCTVIWKKVEVSKVSAEDVDNNTFGNAVVDGGVSMLKTDNPAENQALRFYFGYDTTNGTDIFIAGDKYNVVSRGILLAKGAEASRNIKRDDADSKYVYDINTTELYKCWNAKSYDDTKEQLYYSCYISDIESENGEYNDKDRFYARGYVVCEMDGKLYNIYSKPQSCTVKEVAVLNHYHNEGNYALTNEKNRKLVWNVEFETDTRASLLKKKLNNTVYTMVPDYETLYSNTSENQMFLDSGNLVLRMTKDSETNIFTTANSLSTMDRMSFKYGYVEMRAKLPYQYGMWLSFWMQPDKRKLPQGFRYYGEIDIVETYWRYNATDFSLHKWYNGYSNHTTQTLNGVDRSVHEGNYTYVFKNYENLRNEYHIYGMEWTPEYIKAYIDGECYYTVYISDEDNYDPSVPGMECFHDYYYLCWNNWMHSSYAEELEFENGYADYAIDYVRIYQNENEDIYIYQ